MMHEIKKEKASMVSTTTDNNGWHLADMLNGEKFGIIMPRESGGDHYANIKHFDGKWHLGGYEYDTPEEAFLDFTSSVTAKKEAEFFRALRQAAVVRSTSNKYFLVGIPGSGKTTLGEKAADVLQIPFFDTDQMTFEKARDATIRDIFSPAFQERYKEALQEALASIAELNTPALIATGAEVALIPKCVKEMSKLGTIIHVKRSPKTIIEDFASGKGENKITLLNETTGKTIDISKRAVGLYSEELIEYDTIAHLTLDNNGDVDEGIKNLMLLIASHANLQY